MSHYSIQEVDQRAGMHGYRATGPILPDRLRVRGRQRGAGATEGGEAVLGFVECKMSRTQRLVCVYGTTIRKSQGISVSSQIVKSPSPNRMLLPLLNVASNVLHQMMKHRQNVIRLEPFHRPQWTGALFKKR